MNKLKDIFKEGANDIDYVSSTFLEQFGDREVEDAKPLKPRKLERFMRGTEIISELKPDIVTFGEIWATFKNRVYLLKNGYTNIFRVKNAEGEEWLVGFSWVGDGRREGWHFNAYHPTVYDFRDGNQVFLRDSDSSDSSETLNPPLTLGNFDPLALEFSYKGKKYKVIEHD